MVCKAFAGDCNGYEFEAIQLIIRDIIQSSDERKEKDAKEAKPDPYLKPLEKDNWWGKVVLALAEAFDVAVDKTETGHNVRVNIKQPVDPAE